jgi:Spy/CpxP family protein refolding chaperone
LINEENDRGDVMFKVAARPFACAIGTLILTVYPPTEIESARWWRSPRCVAILNLTPTQAAAIQRLYENTLSEQRARAVEAEEARAKLNRLLDSDGPDADVEAAASQAAGAEAVYHRVRTLMLYRMFRVLSPEQQRRLDTLVTNRQWQPAN